MQLRPHRFALPGLHRRPRWAAAGRAASAVSAVAVGLALAMSLAVAPAAAGEADVPRAVAPAPAPAPAPALTPTELRWLRGLWPVVAFARAAGWPLDVVVQPQPAPDLPPLALAFVDQRCKLVLSMRDNPAARSTLQALAPDLEAATLALMGAHELGHCRRHLQGTWLSGPSSFADPTARPAPPAEVAATGEALRREEAYGDLVGLAWTQRHHPQHYARLHAWLVAERSADRVPGGLHDTLDWVLRAAQPQTLAAAAAASVFDAAAALWAQAPAPDPVAADSAPPHAR